MGGTLGHGVEQCKRRCAVAEAQAGHALRRIIHLALNLLCHHLDGAVFHFALCTREEVQLGLPVPRKYIRAHHHPRSMPYGYGF